MRHTADPKSFLGYVCDTVSRLKPGQAITVDGYELRREVGGFNYNGADFTPADRVLGNIIGSKWTHSFREDPMSGNVTFIRHEDSNRVRYEAPDRKEPKTDA